MWIINTETIFVFKGTVFCFSGKVVTNDMPNNSAMMMISWCTGICFFVLSKEFSLQLFCHLHFAGDNETDTLLLFNGSWQCIGEDNRSLKLEIEAGTQQLQHSNSNAAAQWKFSTHLKEWHWQLSYLPTVLTVTFVRWEESDVDQFDQWNVLSQDAFFC